MWIIAVAPWREGGASPGRAILVSLLLLPLIALFRAAVRSQSAGRPDHRRALSDKPLMALGVTFGWVIVGTMLLIVLVMVAELRINAGHKTVAQFRNEIERLVQTKEVVKWAVGLILPLSLGLFSVLAIIGHLALWQRIDRWRSAIEKLVEPLTTVLAAITAFGFVGANMADRRLQGVEMRLQARLQLAEQGWQAAYTEARRQIADQVADAVLRERWPDCANKEPDCGPLADFFGLFRRYDILRQIWTADEVRQRLGPFPVVDTSQEEAVAEYKRLT